MTINNFGEYYKQARTKNPNKSFLETLHAIQDKGTINNNDIVKLKQEYDKVRKQEQNKILTISKKELQSLGVFLGLSKKSENQSMNKVLNTLIQKSKEILKKQETEKNQTKKPTTAKVKQSQKKELKKEQITLPTKGKAEEVRQQKKNATLPATAKAEEVVYKEDKTESTVTRGVKVGSEKPTMSESTESDTNQSKLVTELENIPDIKDANDITLRPAGKFNYENPQTDANGNLIARTDLLDPTEVENGYSDIGDLFAKLNSMTPTQVEPGFKPYYYGETDKKTGEKIPTFILIGDIHADEYNFSNEELQTEMGKDYLIEKNENNDAEVEVLQLLKDKFNITTIGLENEVQGKQPTSRIGTNTKQAGMNYIGLENKELHDKMENLEEQMLVISIKSFELKGVDLDIRTNKEEVIKIMNKKEVNDYFESTPKPENFKNKQDLIHYLVKSINSMDKELLEDIYKVMVWSIENAGGIEYFQKIIQKTKESYKNSTIKTLAYDVVDAYITNEKVTIQERNTTGINIISKHLGTDKVAVMVYGKAHLRDLEKQLKEKYNDKVNIYTAK